VSLLFVVFGSEVFGSEVFGSEVLMMKLRPARDLRCLAGLRSLLIPYEHVLQCRNVSTI
jgi:hypothetical protein